MEYLFAIVGFLAFAATTVEIVKNQNARAIGLFVVTVASLVFAAVLWTRDKELRDSRKTAAQVLEGLPPPSQFNFVTEGEVQGVVPATIGFLEAHRKQLPDSLSIAEDTYRDLRQQLADDDPRKCPESEPITCPSDVAQRNRDRTERAAGAAYALLRSIAGEYAPPLPEDG
jgi:hypothetical protein